jgi:hypothetical protein
MRRRTAAEKKLADNAWLTRAWRRWRRERVEQLLGGPYAAPAQALLKFFKTMIGPSALIDFVKAGPWENADEDVRFEILALIDAVIVKRRERIGLAPFDDALPGQAPNVFLILREQLAPSSSRLMAAPSGANAGSSES